MSYELDLRTLHKMEDAAFAYFVRNEIEIPTNFGCHVRELWHEMTKAAGIHLQPVMFFKPGNPNVIDVELNV